MSASYPGFIPPITFDKSMAVAVNGDWIPWRPWFPACASAGPHSTNVPGGTWLYSQTALFPRGSSVQLTYKYGIDDSADNRKTQRVSR